MVRPWLQPQPQPRLLPLDLEHHNKRDIKKEKKKKKKEAFLNLELECREHDGICTSILEVLTSTEQQYPALEDLSMDGTQDNVLLSVQRKGLQY